MTRNNIQTAEYSTLLYNQRHLILKWAEGKEPYVICECYSAEVAATICNLLESKEEKSTEN